MTTQQPMLFFFGSSSPLSNWHVAPFNYQPRDLVAAPVQFFHVEQFMMYCKARLFNDEETALKILFNASPKECKQLGRQVRNYDEQVWNAHREPIVLRAILEKFRAHPSKRAYLLSTKGRRLVEAAPNDRIWGVGLAADDPRINDPRQWQGRNLLGTLLEEARDILEKEYPC